MLSVLHVTEATGAGVMSAIDSYRHSTPQLDHHVLTLRMRQHPDDLAAEDGISTINAVRSAAPGQINHIAKRLGCDVVHAHSTIAGLLSRVAWPSPPIVYTPHCFAFQRTMRPAGQRALWALEKAASRRTALFAACSASEAAICREICHDKVPVIHVPHAIDVREFSVKNDDPAVVRIAMAGRICAQKDPEFFVDVVEAVRRRAVIDAVWIGDGDDLGRRLLEAAGIRVTGWLDTIDAEMEQVDIYVHSAAWEGEALTPLEAAGAGVPVVMRARPGSPAYRYAVGATTAQDCADVVVTMFDTSARWAAAERGVQAVRDEYTESAQATALLAAYEGAVAGRT
ncbi:MAG: glycosyltransferase [Ilumatobacteraceae bacterium]